MMLQKLSAWACAILVTCTTATLCAQVEISNFDDGTTQGWAAANGSIITASDYESANHATTGSHALNVFMPPSSGFKWAMVLSDPTLGQKILANPIIEADVSWTTSEWTIDPDGAWARWDQAALNYDGSPWLQTNDSYMSDSANPSYPGSWDPVNWDTTHKRTISWDYSSLIVGEEADIAASPWFQLHLAVNFDAAFNTAPGYSFWIDSIRLRPADNGVIPEPTSLALAGLCGACALLGRRR
jgi:hypothetical protein